MLTQDRLFQVCHYDPKTGVFTNLETRGRVLRGAILGYADKDGYLVAAIDGKPYRLHRLAFLYMEGRFPDVEVDHENMCRSDNRWDNIRRATKSQNGANRRALPSNRSGFKGVSLHKASGLYRATIVCRGKQYSFGYEKTARAAHEVYLRDSKKLFGQFARTA